MMAEKVIDREPNGGRLASVGWAISHEPTREAYRRCTGEDVGPVLDRYTAWLEENIVGERSGVTC